MALRLSIIGLLLACGATQAAQPAPWAQKAPDGVMQAMEQGEPQDLIVLFDDAAIRQAAEDMRSKLRVKTHTAAVQAMKSARYKTLKQDALNALPVAQHEMLKDYSHLPMAFMRFHTAASLRALLQRSDDPSLSNR